MAFLPSAILGNHEKFNESLITFNNEFFKTNDQQYIEMLKYDPSYMHKDVTMLNYFNPDSQNAELRDNYTTQSPIYLKGLKSQSLIIADNVFQDNIGLLGGSIHIDLQRNKYEQPDENTYSPFILIKNNQFIRNIAYFQGNAIFIKGGQEFNVFKVDPRMFESKFGFMQVLIENCIFEKNYGFNVAYGSAIAITGM